ncbi:MAG TPA: protein phosphatase 2C domain-containing protein [Pseudonocardiaceae bacterium]
MTGQFCRQCAEPVGPRDRFCEHCGSWVAASRRDHVEIDVGSAAGVSDRGLRHHRNEDALALRDISVAPALGPALGGAAGRREMTVAVVCDGVSSSARPDEASEVAAEVAAEALVAALHAADNPAAATHQAIRAADKAVAEMADHARADGAVRSAPACTFVSAVVTGNAVTVGWVGDSRAYWVPEAHPDAAPAQLTRDDSWLAEVLAAGTLSPAQAAADRRAHAVTAWLGEATEPVDPHVITLEPEGPGVVVVCTDGLWNYLDTADQLPAQALDRPLDTARRLVDLALHRGGHDNITVAVLPFPPAAGQRSPGGLSCPAA